MAKAEKKTKAELFHLYVGNIAGHAANLRVETGRIRMSAVPGMGMVEFFVERSKKPWDIQDHVWDQCSQIHEDGTEEHLGNRHAMIARYSSIASEALKAFMEAPE
jgi:hypothetical protein